MAWSTTRWMREAHFFSSLLFGLVLLFFAATGFMAQHREWFHPRVDRDALGAPQALGVMCDDASLQAIAWGSSSAEARGRWLFVDGEDARWACRPGEDTYVVGRILPWPDGVPVTVEAYRAHWESTQARRLDEVQGAVGAGSAAAWLRFVDVWTITTWEVEPVRARVVVWEQSLPLAFSLIEVHRGRGSTDVLVDAAAILAFLVALSGVGYGLRYPGARRRLLVGLGLASALFVLALLAG